MGGLSSIAGDVVEREASEGIGNFLSRFADGQGYFKTARDILSKSEAGKILLEHIDNTIIPQSRKTAQAYFDAASSTVSKSLSGQAKNKAIYDIARESKMRAWGDVRQTYLGKKDEVLISSIYNATKEKGVNYGNMMADSLNIVFHDAGESFKLPGKDITLPSWRTERVKLSAGAKGISLSDVGIREKALFKAPEQLEKSIKNTIGWMYAPLIAIPHMSQVGAILLDSGIKATAKAVFDYGSIQMGADHIFQGVLRSGTLFDELSYEMKADAAGKGIFEKMFHFPGFNWVRRQELTLGALAGKHAIIEASEKYARDSSDKWAKYGMEKLGLKAEEFEKNDFQLRPEDIERAMFKEANRSIMITRELDIPWKWQESAWSRLAFQYKDFAYRYGRFLSSSVANAYKYGGPTELAKTILILGTVFPALGEIVHSMENVATTKNPLHRDNEGSDEYFSAFGYAGGLGIFNSMWRAGMYNYGKGWLEGPIMSAAEDVLVGVPTHVYKAGKYLQEGDTYKAEKQMKAAGREVFSKAGWPGRIIAEQLKDPKP
jgi:hypothetical protein